MRTNSVCLAADEATVLQELSVQLLDPADQPGWEALMGQHHYLKNAHLVGEQLRYVVTFRGQWVALLAWCAAAYHLKGRDTWIGWSDAQRQARLRFVANNARFCLLVERGVFANLASRALALCTQRLSSDWQAAYGHPILIVESFVDTQLFRGTAYKANGWRALGATAGYARVNEDFYVAHDRPKTLFVRELVKHAARTLRARTLPPLLAVHQQRPARPCDLPTDELSSLWAALRTLPEARDAQGLRHSQATVLAITFCSLFNGKAGGYRQAALYAHGLTRQQRVALRCWFNSRTRQYDVPSENCFYRVLTHVSVSDFQRVIWRWQAARWGFLDGPVLALDGKTLRGSGTTHLVGAVNLQSGRTVGVERVADKSNEIPAGQTLLGRLELDGLTVLLDALHTQVQTARAIVQEGGGGYVMVVKGNQSGLLEQARLLLPEAVPPYRRDSRDQRGAAGAAGDHRAPGGPGANGLSSRPATGPSGSAPPPQERQRGDGNDLADHQPEF
jgi:hypothetical protein